MRRLEKAPIVLGRSTITLCCAETIQPSWVYHASGEESEEFEELASDEAIKGGGQEHQPR
jgi:hypothetical protein